MTDMLIKPPRKDLEYIPIRDQGRQLVVIRDRFGLVQEGIAILPQVYQFLVLLDSAKDIQELQNELNRQSNEPDLNLEEICQVIDRLDQSFLLDSERFRQAKGEIVSDFQAKSMRHPCHLGKSYPDRLEDLQTFLDSILSLHTDRTDIPRRVQAVVAPHIDIQLGKDVYSCAYNQIKGTKPSRVIVFGIGHSLDQGLFSLTDKDFTTPLGILHSDSETIQVLRQKGDNILVGHDFDHKTEHSIEFQTIFFHHLLSQHSYSIVPILCGSLQRGLPEYSREAFVNTAGPFLQALKDTLRRPDEQTLVIAGVDFSHIGPKFGHNLPAKEMESEAREHDYKLLNALCQRDARSFWAISAQVNDQYNVCGFSALACLLEILPPACYGKILAYDMWHEEETDSAVGFAASCFSDK